MKTQLEQVCEICNSKENLILDKDEEAGIVFGTVCERCQMILTLSDRDPERIAKMAHLAEQKAKGLIRMEPIEPNREDTWHEIIDVEDGVGDTPVL